MALSKLDSTSLGTMSGNLSFASGQGIDFSATDNTNKAGASMASELFHDYEEGTWTPLIKGGSTDPSSTAASQNTGYYTKIGRMVYLNFVLNYTSVSGGSGDFRLGGFPFTSTNLSDFRGSGNVSFFRGVTHGGNRLAPHLVSDQTSANFYENANATEFDVPISTSDLSSTVMLHGFMTYITD